MSYELGVLVVHGIGDQRQGSTLTIWVDAITSWLRRWKPSEHDQTMTTQAVVPVAELNPSSGPAHVEVQVCIGDDDQKWLFAEGWWAGTFDPPSFGELWGWSFVSVPATAAMHGNALVRDAFARYRAARGPQALVEAGRILLMLAALLAGVMLSPIVLALFTVLLLLGIIAAALPIEALRAGVLKAQLLAVGTIGDTKRLVGSPTQAGAIKSPVMQGIRWLRAQGCERVVILAHSQGAAVTYKTLRDIADGLHGDVDPIASFVSVGSGLPKVHALEYLSSKAGAMVRNASVAVPVSAVITALGLRHIDQRGAWGAMWGMAAIGMVALVALAALLYRKLRDYRAELDADEHANPEFDDASAPIAVVVALAMTAAIVWSFNVDQGPVALVAAWSIVVGVASVGQIAMQPIPALDHALEGVTTRWLDLYASKDPVPAGPTRTATRGRPESFRVTNLGSATRDHNTYTTNDDECLTYIGTELLEAAGVPIQAEAMRQATTVYGYERRWRVGWRAVVTWLLTAASALFAYTTWGGADGDVASMYAKGVAPGGLIDTWYPGNLPSFVPDTISNDVAQVIAAVGYVIVGALAVQIGQRIWAAWNAGAVADELAGKATDDTDVPLAFRAMIGVVVFWWFVAAVPNRVWSEWQAIDLTSWRGLLLVAAAVAVPLLFATWLPRLLVRLGFKAWAVSRDTGQVEGLIGRGAFELAQGNTAGAVASFRSAKAKNDAAGYVDAGVSGGLARALMLHARLLRHLGHQAAADLDGARRSEQATQLEAQADAADAEALEHFAAAADLIGEVRAATLVDYANHVALRDPDASRIRVMVLLSAAERLDATDAHLLSARVSHRLESRRAAEPAATHLRKVVDSLLPEQQLEARFALMAAAGPGLDSDGDRLAIVDLLTKGHRARVIDLRHAVATAHPDWTPTERESLAGLARQVADLEELVVDVSEKVDVDRDTTQPAEMERTPS